MNKLWQKLCCKTSFHQHQDKRVKNHLIVMKNQRLKVYFLKKVYPVLQKILALIKRIYNNQFVLIQFIKIPIDIVLKNISIA